MSSKPADKSSFQCEQEPLELKQTWVLEHQCFFTYFYTTLDYRKFDVIVMIFIWIAYMAG